MDHYAEIQRQLSEHTNHLKEHDRRFDEHDRRFDKLECRLDEFHQEFKDEIRGLHLRFESLEDTMRLVAERVSEFNRETGNLRGRVTNLETSQINTDLRLIALERKRRKS
ncbi:MAG: hypothetical protein KF760_35080 [Candidatus Eremiobacteraeota bacterium]|nr:hypothetical protein [Candidatus Eremiobacteraeota bacterium]MCW5870861.1 hypothetical protein [Candidatus Eremiobacteraeota bacterium]